ncbi:MAG TPA: KGG domain-containing protein [Candidatus Thermoplasmatota archaeon]|nr:KGG domain-containing protein [Candidatus Thermoplasmatota archaeon]
MHDKTDHAQRRVSNTDAGLTTAEAGRKGGEKVREAYGPDFFRRIGMKGGQARRNQLGPGGFSELGQMGGEVRKQQLGPGGYQALGKKGGDKVKQKYGSEFYAEIGRKGGIASWTANPSGAKKPKLSDADRARVEVIREKLARGEDLTTEEAGLLGGAIRVERAAAANSAADHE